MHLVVVVLSLLLCQSPPLIFLLTWTCHLFEYPPSFSAPFTAHTTVTMRRVHSSMSQPFQDKPHPVLPPSGNSRSQFASYANSIRRVAIRWSPLVVLVLLSYILYMDSRCSPSLVDSPVEAANPPTIRARVVDWAWEHRLKALRIDETQGQGRSVKVYKDRNDAVELANKALYAPKPTTPYKMVMCTRIWNEAKYIEEWLRGFLHVLFRLRRTHDSRQFIIICLVSITSCCLSSSPSFVQSSRLQ